jgi:Tol biopolymer transport system component
MERIVARCLRKDRARRFQHMLDLKVALEELKEESDSGRLRPAVVVPPRQPKWRTSALAGIAMVVLAVAALWFGWLRDRAPGATPTPAAPLTSFNGFERTPAFSPDGKQIAFSWGGEKADNQDIYVMLVTGGQPLRLTTDPAPDTDPVWSPDGAQIAFVRAGNVRLISPLGGPETKVTESACRGLDWSADGKWLAVANRNSANEPCSVFLVSPGTRERRQLHAADLTSLGDCEPAFSPDGRMLAFVRERRVNAHELWTIPSAGGTARKLISDESNIQGVAWMPGSREIVYSSDVGGFWNLWRVPAEGGKARPVPNTADGRSLAISATAPPRLAFALETRNIDIWRMAVPEGVPKKIIASTRADWSPRYSPDGSKLVFMSDRGGTPQLWWADSDGSHQRVLLTDTFAGAPRWSPDGSQIAFDTKGDIAVVSAEGGERKLLTQGPMFDARPAWSRDGRWIYFRSNRSGTMQIWKMPAEGGTPTQTTREGAWEAMEAPDGKRLYYIKDRSAPGLWSVPVTGGEAQLVASNVRISWWTPAGDDIYYVDFSVRPPAIQQMNLKTRAVRTLRTVENLWPDFSPSMTGSPDGRWLVWSLEERLGSDLMLIDDFR